MIGCSIKTLHQTSCTTQTTIDTYLRKEILLTTPLIMVDCYIYSKALCQTSCTTQTTVDTYLTKAASFADTNTNYQ